MTTDRGPLAKLLTLGLGLVVVLLSLSLGLEAPARAAEPDGRIRLETVWLEKVDPARPGPGRLRLHLRSLTPVHDLSLTINAPLQVSLRVEPGPSAIEFNEITARGGERALRADLGRVAPSSGLALEFEVQIEPQDGGVVTFVVDARTADGRPFREALGLIVGKPGPTGTRRLGAVEFPAAVGPPRQRER